MNKDEGITLKEFFIHLWDWLKTCPVFESDPHVFSGSCGDPKMECIICHRIHMDSKEEMAMDVEEIEEVIKELKELTDKNLKDMVKDLRELKK